MQLCTGAALSINNAHTPRTGVLKTHLLPSHPITVMITVLLAVSKLAALNDRVAQPWLLFAFVTGIEIVRCVCMVIMIPLYPRENLSAP